MNIVELLRSEEDIDDVFRKKYWISCYLRDNMKLFRAKINTKPILVTLEDCKDIIHVRHNGKIKYSLHLSGAVMYRNDKVKPVEYYLKLPLKYKDEIQFFNSREEAIKYYNDKVDRCADELERNSSMIIKHIRSNKIKL